MKIAIVTGASSGMGAQFVMEINRHYQNLDEIWVISRRHERMEYLQRKVQIPLRILDYDLTKKDSLKQFRRLINSRMPKVYMLVNCAGFGKVGDCTEIRYRDQTDMIDLNCRALTALTKMTVPYMVPGSHIIQMASAAAFMPQQGFAVYSATKAYVLSYARALNRELRKHKISVTAVCPGPVDTNFFHIAESTGYRYSLKKIFMVKKGNVVRKAMKDALAGKEMSVYGFWMKGFHFMAKIIPHKIMLKGLSLIK